MIARGSRHSTGAKVTDTGSHGRLLQYGADLMDDLLPDDDAPDLPLLHERDYVVRAYVAAPDEILVRGVIHDVKPPGLLVEGDTAPLTMHHMVVELRVHYPSLDIIAAHVRFDAYPQPMCPTIAAHYESLVGLSIARGFTHQVRELFGGPRGCSHTTALLQAMAPVAVQSWFGMARLSGGAGAEEGLKGDPLSIVRSAHRERNLNTCHIWAEDSELTQMGQRGEAVPLPLPVLRRYAELGRDG